MIVLNDVYKTFGERVLFNGLNFTIDDGEFVVIIGSSGCGKTTLLNMIGAIETISSGKIIVDGMDISKRKYLRHYYMYKVGFLFQNFALIDNKSVRDNIEIVQKNAREGISTDEALKRVGLYEKINEKVYKLSGGEQQRIALARLMYKKCDIILADEPTGSLDEQNTHSVMQILREMNKIGKTIIMVTHNSRLIPKESRVIKL